MPNISAIGPARRGDIFGVAGVVAGLPVDADIIFTQGTTEVRVTPDIRACWFVSVAQVPDTVPLGFCTVRLQGATWASDSIQVYCENTPPRIVRSIYSGRTTSRPYTIAFVANPWAVDITGALVQDTVAANRPGFLRSVMICLASMVGPNSPFSSDNGIMARIVAIFDPGVARDMSAALVEFVAPDFLYPRSVELAAFPRRYGESPDVVIALSDGLGVFDRATSRHTIDDESGGDDFTFDGTVYTHRPYCSTPGTSAIDINTPTGDPVARHEFYHAASSTTSGRIGDLYLDISANDLAYFTVNKKLRGAATDPVPVQFGRYGNQPYSSTPDRCGRTYPATWKSYHCEKVPNNIPNIMDSYYRLGTETHNPMNCGLDAITERYIKARLATKTMR